MTGTAAIVFTLGHLKSFLASSGLQLDHWFRHELIIFGLSWSQGPIVLSVCDFRRRIKIPAQHIHGHRQMHTLFSLFSPPHTPTSYCLVLGSGNFSSCPGTGNRKAQRKGHIWAFSHAVSTIMVRAEREGNLHSPHPRLPPWRRCHFSTPP